MRYINFQFHGRNQTQFSDSALWRALIFLLDFIEFFT